MPPDSPMNYSHAAGFSDPKNTKPATIIGAGSVSSYVALGLVKAGYHDLTVWDNDFVASDNMPMSLFGPSDFGKPKAEALRDIVERLTGVTIKICTKRYESERLTTPLVVSCVDDMPTRERIWEGIKGRIAPELFCDTRLGYTYVEVLTIRPNLERDINRYKQLIGFKNEVAVQQTCGHHGVVYASMYAASVVVPSVVAHFSGKTPPPWRVAQRCDTLERAF